MDKKEFKNSLFKGELDYQASAGQAKVAFDRFISAVGAGDSYGISKYGQEARALILATERAF